MKLFAKFLTISSLLFLQISCNIEDDQHEDHKHDYSKTNIKRITIKDAVVNTNAFNKLTKPNKQIKNINGRVINDTINNFSIETESGTYIEKENYHSYTFKVIRENGSDFLLENIVVDKYNDSDYRTFLYQYDITQDELNLINNNQYVDLNNKISIIVLENSSISNYLNTNSKIDYNSMCYVSNTYYVEGSFICPLGNHNYSNYPSCDFFKDGTVLPTHGNWATDVSLTPCVDAGGINNTDAGNESPSGENGGSGTGGSSTTTPTTTNYQKLREKCITENNPEVSSWLNQPENADIKNDVIDYLENSVNPDGLQSTESCYDESSEEFQNVMDMYDILDDGMVNGEPILVGPDVPIYDMAEYLSCFNTSLGATITIYADQPTSGAHDLLGDDGVGHAFVSIKQGTNIATLGFYPISTTGSVFGATPGIYGNDQNHSYDVSISVSVSSIKLTQIIGNLISNTDPIYELHQYNCTDVAVGIGNVSGMNIPSCESPSVWNGDTPGTLGEMIRNMPTPSGGSKNLTGGNAPLNNCN